MFTAISLGRKECKIDIVLSPGEEARFKEAMVRTLITDEQLNHFTRLLSRAHTHLLWCFPFNSHTHTPRHPTPFGHDYPLALAPLSHLMSHNLQVTNGYSEFDKVLARLESKNTTATQPADLDAIVRIIEEVRV
jgi:hypothetical protein